MKAVICSRSREVERGVRVMKYMYIEPLSPSSPLLPLLPFSLFLHLTLPVCSSSEGGRKASEVGPRQTFFQREASTAQEDPAGAGDISGLCVPASTATFQCTGYQQTTSHTRAGSEQIISAGHHTHLLRRISSKRCVDSFTVCCEGVLLSL